MTEWALWIGAGVVAFRRRERLRWAHLQPPLSVLPIPDWLLLGPEMRVPCTAYEMAWVGADGTVLGRGSATRPFP